MNQLDIPQMMAMAAALGWASGLRLYLAVFLTGLVGKLGYIDLPTGLEILEKPVMLGASGFMLFAEFFADKIPGFDSMWDTVHTFIRIPAGAAMAASVFGADDASWGMAAALLGGTLAATSHAAKATTRAAVNTSPEPFSNVALSLAGDAMVPAGLWLSVEHPMMFWAALAVMVVVMIALIWTFARFLKGLIRRLSGRSDDPAMVT